MSITDGERDPEAAAASMLARAAFMDELDKTPEKAGRELPKGACPVVDRAGRKILAEAGAAAFVDLAKIHFNDSVKIGL